MEGGTNYGAAFRALAQTIGQDTAALKAAGYKVYRPCAFFLTDGEPHDRDWLRDLHQHAHLRPGHGRGHEGSTRSSSRSASGTRREDVLRKLAYPRRRGKWYHIKTHDIGQALKGILEIIMNTVVTSGQSGGSGPAGHHPATASCRAADIQQGDSDYRPPS